MRLTSSNRSAASTDTLTLARSDLGPRCRSRIPVTLIFASSAERCCAISSFPVTNLAPEALPTILALRPTRQRDHHGPPHAPIKLQWTARHRWRKKTRLWRVFLSIPECRSPANRVIFREFRVSIGRMDRRTASKRAPASQKRASDPIGRVSEQGSIRERNRENGATSRMRSEAQRNGRVRRLLRGSNSVELRPKARASH